MDERLTFEQKTLINKMVQERLNQLNAEGKHGYYETVFKVVHEAIEQVKQYGW